MSWFKKSEKHKPHHAFFSLTRAKVYGFYIMHKPNGEKVHITDIIDFDYFMDYKDNLDSDAIYVGVVEGDYYKADPEYDPFPIVNGRPIKDWNDD